MNNKPENRVQWELQVQVTQLRINQAHARSRYYEQRVVTGVWRKRHGHVFQGGYKGTPLTMEELLEDELQTMNNHIERAEELIDRLNELLALESTFPSKN